MGNKKINTIKQFITFNIVGVLNAILTFVVYSLFIYFSFSYEVALIADYVVGVLFSFFTNKKYTFKIDKFNYRMFIQMILLYVLIFFVNYYVLIAFINMFNFNPYMAQILFICILVVVSFIVQKFFIFKV